MTPSTTSAERYELSGRASPQVTDDVAADVSELAIALASGTSKGGASALGAASGELGRLLSSAIEQANLKVVQSVYAKEVMRSGFEQPFGAE